MFTEGDIQRHAYKGKRSPKLINSKGVMKCIQNFLVQTSVCFTAADIRSFIFKEINVEIPVDHIRTHLREKHNLVYKKVKSRPSKLDLGRQTLLKSLY